MTKLLLMLLIGISAPVLLSVEKPVSSPVPVEVSDEIVPVERRLVTEVGLLYKNTPQTFGAKYILKNSGVILAFIVEPSDVDMAFMIGRPITLSGYLLGRSKDGTNVIEMRNAATFG